MNIFYLMWKRKEADANLRSPLFFVFLILFV